MTIEYDQKYNEIISRLDAAQRAEASIHQLLNSILREVEDLKRRLHEGRR